MPATVPAIVTDKARALILEFEGMDQPHRWPGESSGVTLGHGYDLGYMPADTFAADWKEHLTPKEIARLKSACGVRGEAARDLAGNFKGITITAAAADAVFTTRTLPAWSMRTAIAFPGIEKLPPDAQGALVSLCFNRGTAMDGERRVEIRRIREAIWDYATSKLALNHLLERVAGHLRAMCRLWPATPGLQRRRHAEADLVANATA